MYLHITEVNVLVLANIAFQLKGYVGKLVNNIYIYFNLGK